MKSLIVGVTGCAGSHLAVHLLSKGHEVYGTIRDSSDPAGISHIQDSLTLCHIDLESKESISGVLQTADPDHVYYLVSLRPSNDLGPVYDTNVRGAALFFQALSEMPVRPRTVMVSSSAVYGIQRDPGPVHEDAPFIPTNHYALTKIFQEEIARFYLINHGMDIIIARPFNHPGPGEKEGLVCADFAAQIVEIERGGKAPVIEVGCLDAVRDFTDVRDVVRGYALLSEKGGDGSIYNICSGRGTPVKKILDILISKSTARIDIHVDSGKIHASEVNIQIGDNSRICSETGWWPDIPLDTTLHDVLEYYREKS